MFNPLAQVWNPRLAGPCDIEPGCKKQSSFQDWHDWEEYNMLYERFEYARFDPDPGRPHLKQAIEALSQCNYVHLCGGASRVIETSHPHNVFVTDITDRRCLVVPPPPDRILWCTDETINLNTQTQRMRDMSGAKDDAGLLYDESSADERQKRCLYITRDPRITTRYATLLWETARQRIRPGAGWPYK
jgi:hypothetical protein